MGPTGSQCKLFVLKLFGPPGPAPPTFQDIPAIFPTGPTLKSAYMAFNGHPFTRKTPHPIRRCPDLKVVFVLLLLALSQRHRVSEKISCPYKFLPAILGPEMAAPILSGIFWLFLQEQTSMPIKFLVLGGAFWVWGGRFLMGLV